MSYCMRVRRVHAPPHEKRRRLIWSRIWGRRLLKTEPYYAATSAQWDRTSTLACIVFRKQKGGTVVSRFCHLCKLWSPLQDGAGSAVVCDKQLLIWESWRMTFHHPMRKLHVAALHWGLRCFIKAGRGIRRVEEELSRA